MDLEEDAETDEQNTDGDLGGISVGFRKF